MKSIPFLVLALAREHAHAWHPHLEIPATKPISRSDAIKGVLVGSVFLASQTEPAFADCSKDASSPCTQYSDDGDDDLKGLLKKLKDPDAPTVKPKPKVEPTPAPAPEPAPAPAPKAKKPEPVAVEPPSPTPAPKPVEPETSSADEKKARAKTKAEKANANYAKSPSPAPAEEAEEKTGGIAFPSLPAFPAAPAQAPVSKIVDPAAARRAAEAERKAKVAAAIAEKNEAEAEKRATRK